MLKPGVISFMFSLAVIWPLPSHANVFNTYWPQLFNRSDESPPQSLEPARSPPSAPPLPRYFVHNVKQGMRQPRAPGETIAKKPRFAARPVAQVAVRPFRVINANNRPASAPTTNRISEDALADALKDVDTLNTTIRLDKPDSTAVEPSAPVRHTKENREPKDSKGRLTLIALTPAAAIPAAVVTPVKVQVAAADTEKQADMAWTSMPVARDLPPQVANLGESFIQNVFKQLPSSKKIRNSMPFDEFRLRIKEAIEVSPDVAVVSNLAEQSRSNKSLAMSSLLPQVNGTIDSGKRHTGRDPYLGSSPYEKDGTNLGITVSQLLFDFGSSYFGLRAGKARQKAAEELLVSKKSEQALKTINAFIELERSRDQYLLASENAQSRLELIKLVKERFALGGGTKPDVIRAESRYAEALSTVALASSKVSAAQANYREVFASNPDSVVNGPDHEFVIDGLYKSAEELAGTYPGLLQLARLKDATSEESKAVIAKTLPSFNLIYSNTSSGYLANNVTPSASSSVLVQLSIPFYNGGSDTAKKQDAKLKAMQSELEFQAAMRTFEKSLRQSQAEVLNSEDILASRAVSVRSAIASMRAVREQFAFNKGSLLDVISMQDSLFQAGRDMIDAQADRHLARYRLVHLTSELQKVFQLADQPLTVKD